MRKIALLFLLALLFNSCKKHKLIESPLPQSPPHRGIYVNDFVNGAILGDAAKEDSLLDWASRNSLNHIYLYNTNQIMVDDSLEALLSTFIHKSNNWPHPIKVTLVSGGISSVDNMDSYYDHRYTHPDGIVSEIEFWNGNGSFDYFQNWISYLSDIRMTIYPGTPGPRDPDLNRRFYVGKIRDAAGVYDSLEVANKLVLSHDQIFLANYHNNAYHLSNSTSQNGIRARLALLAEAAFSQNKKVHIVILFNVRQDSPAPNIFSYFDENDQNHTFDAAFQSFKTDFDAANISHKNMIVLDGYGIYRYSDARLARH